ncbi:nucleolar complex protein 3 homolog isoform X1 [Mytilus edulis]|uniref:nucleolar complex protein 3 homolog isoform X1 n=1 Tax=Mytilus edulis TaxID=6550 RepID=UPI0039F0690B
MKMKGKPSRSKTSKTSQSKLANKKHNRLAKQGKLKKRKKKDKDQQSQNEDKLQHQNSGKLQSQKVENGSEEEDQLNPEDVEFYGTPGQTSFVSAAQKRFSNGEKIVSKRKRTYSESGEIYEQEPRKLFAGESRKNMKDLLPIKTKKGIIPQMIEEPNGEASSDIIERDTIINQEPKPLPQLSNIQLLIQRKHNLNERKKKIALLASDVIENPEENMKKLRELRLMLEECESDAYITVKKLVMLSLMEIFKDIIPGYRIRLLTEKEKEQKMKKETKALQDFEQGLLMNYKGYLEVLEKYCTGKINEQSNRQRRHGVKHIHIPEDASQVIAELAVRCMCEMLSNHPHFNYRNNIIAVLVPLMNKHNTVISDMVCQTSSKVFREDKSGEVSLEIVRLINKMVKVRDFRVQRKVLDTFLALKIKEIDTSEDLEENKKKKREFMSRRERKKRKKMANLEHELLETKATEDKKKKVKLHTEIIGAVFLIYFKVLKGYRKSTLLPSVLEGLAKFSHLINIDFFDDLYRVFNELIESEDLTYRESLHVILTAFTILSGQGSALNIDPLKFYTHMYNTLLHVHAGCSSDDLPLVIDCIDCMMNRRKRLISQQRILSYTKRLATLSLQQMPNGTIAFLGLIRNFMLTYKYLDFLFDNDSQGSGIYLPELPEPEHCHAHNTMLLELSSLKSHYHPAIKKYAVHLGKMAPVSGEGQLPLQYKKPPRDLYNEFSTEIDVFNPPVAEKSTFKHKSKKMKMFMQEDISDMVVQVLSSIPD